MHACFDIGPHGLDDSLGVHTHNMITALPDLTVIVTDGRIPLAAALCIRCCALESEWCEIPGCEQEERQQQPATRTAAVTTCFVDLHCGRRRERRSRRRCCTASFGRQDGASTPSAPCTGPTRSIARSSPSGAVLRQQSRAGRPVFTAIARTHIARSTLASRRDRRLCCTWRLLPGTRLGHVGAGRLPTGRRPQESQS